MKPVLLDLYCGAGGAARGYDRAGFRVVGVDIAPQPRYPHLLRASNGKREWVCSSCWRDAHQTQEAKEIRQEQKQWTTPARP